MTKSGIFIFVLFFCVSIFNVSAQKKGGISIEETKNYLNSKLNPKVTVDVKNTRLILTYIKDGEAFRKDQVYCAELDIATLKYVPEEQNIYVKCGADTKDCVVREIYKDKITRNYARTGIDVSGMDEKSINGIQNALRHLINLMIDVKYESTVPFE